MLLKDIMDLPAIEGVAALDCFLESNPSFDINQSIDVSIITM